MQTSDPVVSMANFKIPGTGTFAFSGADPTELEETEYTLATVCLDISGSVYTFHKELLQAKRDSIRACQKSPRANNLLARMVHFNHTLSEQHGFKPLDEIDVDVDYGPLSIGGGTNLYDAVYESVGATLKYAEILADQDYDVNGITFIITDGLDNAYDLSARKRIKTKVDEALQSEKLESLQSVLIGVNVSRASAELQTFQQDAGLTQFIDIGDASPGKLAKLANFISRSISSASQALGTGGPSAPLTF